MDVCDDHVNAQEDTLSATLDALGRLEAAQIPGVTELASAYTTVAVFFDPVRVVEAGAPFGSLPEWLTTRIRSALATRPARKPAMSARIVEIPVCYEREHALDLDEVARHAGLSLADVVRLHSAADYVVACVGFTPGFPFFTGLPVELVTPRRQTPRTAIPAGSVAIGGAQTGIYPMRSPGGWNVIGRTPLRLFDAEADSPSLLRAGDRVRFRQITGEQFEKEMG